MEAVWAFDREGRPLVSSTVVPVPSSLNNSDRDYFRRQAEADSGTYIGDIVQARIGSKRFFVVSGRRTEVSPGEFNGVIAFTVVPEHFREFYARLARGVADSFGLIRADGAFLARFPQVLDRPERLTSDSVFVRSLQVQPSAGVFTATSQIDGIERRIGYRKVPDYPIYVQAGIETGSMRSLLLNQLGGEIAFGLPATLAMFALAMFALRRTENFHAEIARREQVEAALKQAQRLEALGQLTRRSSARFQQSPNGGEREP
jgi:two-component system NtrC family sensor kinase